MAFGFRKQKKQSHAGREIDLMAKCQTLLNDNRGLAEYVTVLEKVLGEAFKIANEGEEALRLMIDPQSTKVAARLRGLAVLILPIMQEPEEMQPPDKEAKDEGNSPGAEGPIPCA